VPVHAVDVLSEGAVSHPTEPFTGSAPHHLLISGGAEPADAAIVARAPGRAHGHPPTRDANRFRQRGRRARLARVRVGASNGDRGRGLSGGRASSRAASARSSSHTESPSSPGEEFRPNAPREPRGSDRADERVSRA
jgi:hypothetical protein